MTDPGGASLAPAPRDLLRTGRPPDQTGIWRWVPGLYVLRHYSPRWLPSDVAAGLTLTAMLVPVGMAYAEAAGLPAIHGLYATIVPLLAYALFGPSRILVLGPDSSLAPMIAAAVVPIAAGDPRRAADLAAVLALLAGAFGVLAGLLRLGFITELLAKPIRLGYMNGIALTVLISQTPKLLGLSVKADALLPRIAGIVEGVADGRANGATVAVGVTALVVILALKRFLRVPGVLLAVAGSTLAAAWLHLAGRYGVSVVGELPRGLPKLALPSVAAGDVGGLAGAAVAIVAVSFADTTVLSRVYATKTRTWVDPNQEMIGLGAANLAAGCFQGFPISSSSSRTPVAEASGSKSQLTGVVGALAIVVLLVFAPGLLADLPQAALAAVVIASAIGLFAFRDVGRLRRIERSEFWLSLAAFVGVILLGPVPGILIAIGLALAEFVWAAWRPHSAVLGRAEGVHGWHDLKRFPDARQVPGLVLFRWDAPLFFANSERFHDAVIDAVLSAPEPVRRVVVAAEPVTNVDLTSVDMLADLNVALERAGIELAFAEMKDPIQDHLKRAGVFRQIGADAFFPTLGAAIRSYLGAHPDVREQWGDTERGDDPSVGREPAT